MTIVEELIQALPSTLYRATNDPHHDWETCNQFSCVNARRVIAKARAGL